MSISYTLNKSIGVPVHGAWNNDWDVPVNADWAIIDNCFGGHSTITVTGVAAGSYALTLAQYQPPNITFTGTLNAALTYYVPAGVGGLWSIFNATIGGGSINFLCAGGNYYTLPQGARTLLICDGFNVEIAQTVASANPSAYVGLSTVSGTALTYMTSDSAPPLSQAIAPVWTGAHTFEAAVNLIGQVSIYGHTILNTGVEFDATTGIILAATQAPGNNTTNVATTAFVAASFAPLASPPLTGTPTVPTAAVNTATTQAASTAFVNRGSSLTTNGYRKHPDGGITQWGRSAGGASPQSVSFPIAFPTACFSIVCTPSSSSVMNFAVSNPASSTTGFTITASDVDPCSWIAEGY